MKQTKEGVLGVIVMITLVAATIAATTPITLLPLQSAQSATTSSKGASLLYSGPRASIATSDGGKNIYLTWWDNKTGNWEVLFARSTDNGKTFSANTTNISNSTDMRSIGARIAASGDNVYIAWIDITNAGQKQVMFRASTDNGKTFSNPVVVSGSNTTTTAAATTTTSS